MTLYSPTSIPSSLPSSVPTIQYDDPTTVVIATIFVKIFGSLLIAAGFMFWLWKKSIDIKDFFLLFISVVFWCFMIIFVVFANSCSFGYCCTYCSECVCSVSNPSGDFTYTAPYCDECGGYDDFECTIKLAPEQRCTNKWESIWCHGRDPVVTTKSTPGHYSSSTNGGLTPFYVEFFIPVVIVSWFVGVFLSTKLHQRGARSRKTCFGPGLTG